MPEEAHPLLVGKADNTRMNYSQLLPYQSSDTRKYQDIYDNMQTVLESVFEFMAEQVSIHILERSV